MGSFLKLNVWLFLKIALYVILFIFSWQSFHDEIMIASWWGFFLLSDCGMWWYWHEIEKKLSEVMSSLPKWPAAELITRKNSPVTAKVNPPQWSFFEQLKEKNLLIFLNRGKVVSGILHDIRNPLAVVSLALEELNSYISIQAQVSESKHLILRAQAAVERIEDITAFELYESTLGKPDDVFGLNQEIQRIISLLQQYAAQHSVQIYLRAPVNYLLLAYRRELSRVIINILINAIEANPNKLPANSALLHTSSEQVVFMKLSQQRKAAVFVKVRRNKHYLLIEIKDHGPGITKAQLSEIFKPFFSGKGGKNNIGIGLSISQEIMKEFYGKAITVQSQVGKGTTFILRIKNRFVIGTLRQPHPSKEQIEALMKKYRKSL